MKTATLLLCSFLFLTASCNSGKEVKIHEPGFNKKIVKNFSDSVSLDTFKVSLEGKEIKEQLIHFTITNSKATVIYSLDVNANDLFKNYHATVDLKREQKKLEFINNELERFLDDENFMEPAVTENETADKNVPDLAFYDELKISSLNGFSYRLGPEQKIYIAWSTKEKKVKVYYNCCKK
ncbi:hypothetical protein ACVWYN_002664 [Pedobacter sp. UYP24]